MADIVDVFDNSRNYISSVEFEANLTKNVGITLIIDKERVTEYYALINKVNFTNLKYRTDIIPDWEAFECIYKRNKALLDDSRFRPLKVFMGYG